MPLERIIRVDESAISAILSRDVKDERGDVLCSGGDRLSARLIVKLKRAGISDVYVRREPRPERKRDVDKRLSQLDERFARVNANPVMHALKCMIAEQIKETARGRA